MIIYLTPESFADYDNLAPIMRYFNHIFKYVGALIILLSWPDSWKSAHKNECFALY